MMAEDLCLENALFMEDYLALVELKKNINPSNVIESVAAIEDGIKSIFKKYIKEGSLLQLNISYLMAKRVEKELKVNYGTSNLQKGWKD